MNVGIRKNLGTVLGLLVDMTSSLVISLQERWIGVEKEKKHTHFHHFYSDFLFPSLTFPTFNLFLTRGWGPGTEAVQVGVPEGVICCSNCLFMFSDEGVYYPEHLLPKFPFSYFPNFKKFVFCLVGVLVSLKVVS